MTLRVDADDVKEIIKTNLTDNEITPFITTANLLVNENLASDSYSTALLTEIEKWLSAHLIAITKERQAQKVKMDDSEETYGRLGLHLNSTTYGQMVTMLDTNGILSNLGKKKASIQAIPSFDDSKVLD